jgi:hypothetical protein
MKIKINDEFITVVEIIDYGYLPLLIMDDGTSWYIAENSDEAGALARESWKRLAEDDPEEFACIIGEKNLIAWALGQSAGPGSASVSSLEEWLDLHLDCPEEHFASWDGLEVDVDVISRDLYEELEFSYDPQSPCPVVAYRQN